MGGQKVSNHAFWAGGKKEGMPLPMETKTKGESSANGAGKLDRYEDTTEAIKSVQDRGESKIRGHKMREGYRY